MIREAAIPAIKLNTIPVNKEYAKESKEPEPKIIKINATINTVILPSNTAAKELEKPEAMADTTLLPDLISSLIRSEEITFASTPIPMDRMIPAIPFKVSVICGMEIAKICPAI